MDSQQTFRPTWQYWVKVWLPIIVAWLILMVVGVQRNIGFPTFNRAISFSIFVSIVLVAAFFLDTRKQITVSRGGVLIQTIRKSYYWPWDQMEGVHFYAVGEESKPRLAVITEQKEYTFPIHAFDDAGLEDAVTARIGTDLVGLGAYQSTERYKKAEEEYKLDLKRYGESKKYIGGSVNNVMYVYALLLEFGLIGISLLFVYLEAWYFAIFILLIAGVVFIRQLSFAGNVYMNRDRIVCKRPWRIDAIKWQDVYRVEVSYRYIIFYGQNKRLVCPGLLFWQGGYAKKMNYLFNYHIEKRVILTTPLDVFSFPRNKNVRVTRS
ncbi:MAG: hypothetical protein IAF02_01150 [Anaerolineae bacterium]|nr:hypothetical protein [Anaerolineae bacterium]